MAVFKQTMTPANVGGRFTRSIGQNENGSESIVKPATTFEGSWPIYRTPCSYHPK